MIRYILILLTLSVYGQEHYSVSMELKNIKSDQLLISIDLPISGKNELIYSMPKVVPGTYSIYNFGRFVHHFSAFNSKGDSLAIEQLNINQWKISGEDISRIMYFIEDTYDSRIPHDIFAPAGTSFEEAKCFMLNPFGIVGYLEGFQTIPYHVKIRKPEPLFGATALQKTTVNDSTDLYHASDYVELADSPIFYTIPDTSVFMIANTQVTISVHSPGNNVSSADLEKDIKPILESVKDYLGDQLPVDRYYFLFYFTRQFTGSFGALEHSYSSMYYLPDFQTAFISQTIRDITAHEFLHILTPLNVHSEQIKNFDFVNPDMSKHLWLYEGLVEYMSHQAQVHSGLITERYFMATMEEKINNAGKYSNIAFTELSDFILEKYQDEYLNVYEKGAIINLCLDIVLLDWSDGKYGVRELILDLVNDFGKQKSFPDDALFDIIGDMTDDSVKDWMKTYIGENTPLPLSDIFQLAGYEYLKDTTIEEATLGNIGISFKHGKQGITISDISDMNDFGKKVGYQQGDIILQINDQMLTETNFSQVLVDFKRQTGAGDKINLVILRDNKKIKKTLEAEFEKVSVLMEIRPLRKLTSRQELIRGALLGKKVN